MANGVDHAVNVSRGPGLREIFLTMRFVFDGTDPFARSIFAVRISDFVDFLFLKFLDFIIMIKLWEFLCRPISSGMMSEERSTDFTGRKKFRSYLPEPTRRTKR